jgi:hypothetical protein
LCITRAASSSRSGSTSTRRVSWPSSRKHNRRRRTLVYRTASSTR